MSGTRSSPRALILTVYGAYVRRLGGWLAVADLVSLVGELGSQEAAVRAATSRLKQAGLVRAETHGGRAGYALTEAATDLLRQGDERIFASGPAADLADGWAVALFSVPERERHHRHQLRRRLTGLGFGQVAPGAWIAPRRALPDLVRTLERDGLARYVTLFEGDHAGFDDTRRLIDGAWDLDGIGRAYRDFIGRHERVAARWRTGPGPERRAYVDYTLALHAWRRLPYLDPGLPAELLPASWPGPRARNLFAELTERLDGTAQAHVRATIEGKI
jgi:phenylacetic acid degradation operon negative regulatory protein